MAEHQAPVIIKKVKKGGHGHHGGAWKLAYADFVTAMMAFFLLMWLLGTTDPSVRQGIAEYFKDPWKPSMQGGPNTGSATSVIKGGGEDITQSEGQVKLTERGQEEVILESSESPADSSSNVASPMDARQETRQLEALKEKIEQMIETNPLMNPFKDQLLLDLTSEGLRIQIIDEEGRPMFQSASARMESYAAEILHQIAPVVNELPNKISIAGHTDAKPFPGGGQGYTNWELSADRANSARKELIRAGLKEEKMMRVVGVASSVPMVQQNPLDARNRRISITVMNRQTSEEVASAGDGVEISAKKPFDKATLLGTGKVVEPPAPAPVVPPLPEKPASKGIPGTLTGGGQTHDESVLPGTLTGGQKRNESVLPGTLTGKRIAPGAAPTPAKPPEPAH